MRIPFFTAVSIPIIALVLQACGGSSSEQETAEIPAYAFDYELVEAREDGCQGEDCAHVTLQIPRLSDGDSAVAKKITVHMEGEIRNIIKDRLPEPMAMGTWTSLAESFIEGYTLFTMEFPDSPGKWYIEVTTDSSVFADGYFTLQIETTEYMGGAHPNYHTALKSYSLASGEPVDVLSHFDQETLKREAEKRFREVHSLSGNESLNDEGMVFPDGTFVLPENMGITPDGLKLIYNPYEVASYAEGQTVITIPLNLIEKKPAA
jgi:hypothetical protein